MSFCRVERSETSRQVKFTSAFCHLELAKRVRDLVEPSRKKQKRFLAALEMTGDDARDDSGKK